jgi:hypothetical protein
LGCAYLTFDLPRRQAFGMMQAMERFVHDVKPRVDQYKAPR